MDLAGSWFSTPETDRQVAGSTLISPQGSVSRVRNLSFPRCWAARRLNDLGQRGPVTTLLHAQHPQSSPALRNCASISTWHPQGRTKSKSGAELVDTLSSSLTPSVHRTLLGIEAEVSGTTFQVLKVTKANYISSERNQE